MSGNPEGRHMTTHVEAQRQTEPNGPRFSARFLLRNPLRTTKGLESSIGGNVAPSLFQDTMQAKTVDPGHRNLPLAVVWLVV